MTATPMDPSDWPPGTESDATVGYVGVRVGERVEVVEPVLPEPWTWAVHNGRWVARAGHTRTRVGADVPGSHHYDGIGCTDRICQMVDERNRRTQTSNPWRRYGLNVHEYGWHAPRSRS